MDQPQQDAEAKRSWLQRLKEESWEAELLVSTVSIYGTFQLFGFVGYATNRFIDVLQPYQYTVGYFVVFMGLVAVSILVSMFVIHFFLRAYWVGLVGLNSVFPDYSLEDSVYSKIYTEKMLAILPKLKDSIDKVDELCSVIFSAAFTFLMLYLYLGLVVTLYLMLYNLLDDYIPGEILLVPAGIFVLILFLQMGMSIIANLKPNLEKRGIQTAYFNIVHWMSRILFGPAYKSIYQVFMIFGSNFKRKKSLVSLNLLFVLAGVVVAYTQIENTNIQYMIKRGMH
ncbi:MAG: hypothetical protein WBG62_11590, partial [Cyclobacteriaceae bacterium]